ncbi:hypothetical protein ACFWF4_22770 [Nocardiopsis flavescens]|uniref:hypothetical protein n=1 Tax=Nocardiopsis flavescens TaxID=758803 RepID=UPI0036536A72
MRTTFLRCSAVAAAVLMLVACADRAAQDESSEPVERTGVSFFWMEREVSVLTLERMFTETGSAEVLGNTDELSVERLLESGAVRAVESGGGHEVVLDKGEWRTDEAANGLSRLDGALGGVMWANEVTWCEGAPDGETFVNAYTEEFEGVFDTTEEYTASAADYVDCGDGRP